MSNDAHPYDVKTPVVVTVNGDEGKAIVHATPAVTADWLHSLNITVPSCGNETFDPSMHWYRDESGVPERFRNELRVDRDQTVSDDTWRYVWLIMTGDVAA